MATCVVCGRAYTVVGRPRGRKTCGGRGSPCSKKLSAQNATRSGYRRMQWAVRTGIKTEQEDNRG